MTETDVKAPETTENILPTDASTTLGGSTIALTRVNAPLAAPTAAADGAGQLMGSYAWRVTFVSPAGETEAGIRSNVLALNGQQVSLTNIPVSQDPSVTARRIYRTTGTEVETEVGRLVVEIPDNTTTTFGDNVPDTSLGVRTPWMNTTGGDITLNGRAYLSTGFSLRFGVKSQPNNSNYACNSIGANSMSAAERLLRSDAFGVDALQHVVSGTGLIAIGTHALGEATSGKDAIAIGYGALQSATSVEACVAIGRAALSESTGTVRNMTALGAYALQSNTTGQNNTAFGLSAGIGVTTGNNNTLFGVETGASLAHSSFNCFVGFQTGKALSNGDQNTSIGFSALGGLTAGSGNTAIGAFAGQNLTSGSTNTFIGSYAGARAGQKADASNSMAIGVNAVTTRDREVVIGNSDDTDFVVLAGISFTKAQLQKLLALASA